MCREHHVITSYNSYNTYQINDLCLLYSVHCTHTTVIRASRSKDVYVMGLFVCSLKKSVVIK